MSGRCVLIQEITLGFFVDSIDDCPEFVDAVNYFIESLADIYNRPEMFVVRIKNWFDHKWLNFAGKTTTVYEEIGETNFLIHPAHWIIMQDTVLPPFSPNRVLAQYYFKVTNEFIEKSELSGSIHKVYKMRSSKNLNNKIINTSRSGLFIWLSSGSDKTGRASLLTYHTQGNRVGGWYVSFIKSDRWKVHLVKGAVRDRITQIFSRYNNDMDV